MHRRSLLAGAALAALPLAGCSQGAAPGLTAPAAAPGPEALRQGRELVQAAGASVAGFMTRPEWEGVRNIMAGARAVFISPHHARAGFVVGLERGAGIVLARRGAEWSDPVFVILTNIDVGFLAGLSDSTAMMLILTQAAVGQFLEGSRRLSGTGGFALADWGVSGLGAGGISGGAQALTVETSRGLFAGGGFGSARMRLDADLNAAAYGPGIDAASILAAPGGRIVEARELRAELARATRQGYGG